MNALLSLTNVHTALGRLLDHLRSLVLLATRFYVGWQFWKSGWLKVTSWESTLDLFRTEYHVPLLPFLLDNVAGIASLNQGDGIHPNVAGAQIVAGNVWTALKPIVDSTPAQ